ncbi:uncharacterized protein GGS22DRAFT_159253 [Annulohypoxylon maeteangense]|uniref:uncharacterized protein n=1 Tax=Annulohypoxylon maeteangense TaxID=1927788 RepID=UPI002007BBE9|nr:uncharacterized protein GGS22DRAFT_159253 [Annulohypoxylon maeteangense]KAI0887041.1 hypothetical protein GGS22DRAFT_159253 [Annulohypoxylon maeteangense]
MRLNPSIYIDPKFIPRSFRYEAVSKFKFLLFLHFSISTLAAAMATFTVEPVYKGPGNIIKPAQFLIDKDLTIRGLKEKIIHSFELQHPTKILIHGLLEKVPENALALNHISGGKIRFVASNDEHANEEEAPKGPKTQQMHKLFVGKNKTYKNGKQVNLIQGQVESERAVDANASENEAHDDSIQKNVISFLPVAISLDF